jgi:hypothetical protein
MATKEEVIKSEVLPDINTKYVYVLAEKNEKRGRIYDEHGNPRGENEYKPRRNLLLRSSIKWPGGKDPFSGKERNAGRHLIRYYDGCTTLFVDDQPKDKETIEQLVNNTRELAFLHGYLSVYGYETLLKNYMDWCSYNGDSPYKIPTTDTIFILLDSEKASKIEAQELDLAEQAMKLAKDAKENKMMVHAQYLGIPFLDEKTNNQRSPEAIRTSYRAVAKNDPSKFISSYNDKSIETSTYIQTALKTGAISTTIIPNKAIWTSNNVEICDISGIKSIEGISGKLLEFSQLPEGGAFDDQLRALYK